MSARSSIPASKRRRRTLTDNAPVPTVPTVPAPTHTPALNDEQLRVLHQVYRIILAHKGAV